MSNYRNQSELLDSKIVALQRKQTENLNALKLQFDVICQELRPSRLLYRAVKDVKEEPSIKNNLFETLISITGGFLSKKILVGKSKSIVKNLFGYTIQYITTSFISRKL